MTEVPPSLEVTREALVRAMNRATADALAAFDAETSRHSSQHDREFVQRMQDLQRAADDERHRVDGFA